MGWRRELRRNERGESKDATEKVRGGHRGLVREREKRALGERLAQAIRGGSEAESKGIQRANEKTIVFYTSISAVECFAQHPTALMKSCGTRPLF